MERDWTLIILVLNPVNFNSHAHVERDHLIAGEEPVTKISTHTLTWSVTIDKDYTRYERKISTHTLTWSVTGFTFSAEGSIIFQLTRSRGA